MMTSRGKARDALRARLSERRGELEHSVLNRVYGISDPTEVGEREYLEGLRDAVAAAIDYGYQVIEGESDDRLPPVPTPLLLQARLAARSNVSLDSVLRRYCAGHSLFSDLLIEEAESAELPRSDLKRLFRALASSLDQILAAVGTDYVRELSDRPQTRERNLTLVQGLLAGELLDPAELRYDLGSWHLGLVTTSRSASDVLRTIAVTFDRALLLINPSADAIWAWFGGRRSFEATEQEEVLSALRSSACSPIAVGEPAQGLAGWRLTHRQASATLPIARRGKQLVVQYAQAPLLASTLQDDLLATSLRELYLTPLQQDRDGGRIARQTLRAYFAAAGNASSAAAALGVTRQTVTSRIRAIEERIGRSVDAVSAEIETALRMAEIEGL